MARKKKEPEVPGSAPPEQPVAPKRNYAEQFARERRVRVLDKSQGEQLEAMLKLAGLSYRERGNKEMRMLTLDAKAFVIDLTK